MGSTVTYVKKHWLKVAIVVFVGVFVWKMYYNGLLTFRTSSAPVQPLPMI